ncbi:N-terminal EF-hand calcium-binding protein 1-like [Amphiura filiformis]|uniref:N-terminal EF-hand calcium-binding protein 1-like n=1 Tax=Amphiura filiformis TaxID=82378 RepID=UPI003B21199A
MASAENEKGLSIFLDVFRRADKNDDNCLSMDEFRSFFADGVLENKELDELFHEIDTHNTNNIDTGELCTYFAEHLGPYKEIFAAMEDLNASVSAALVNTSQEYPNKSFQEKFTVRFLLKEILNQLGSVQRSVDAASDHLERDALSNRQGQTQAFMVDDSSKSNAGWIKRRERRQFATQTSIPRDIDAMNTFSGQVLRLQELVDKLEHKVKIEPIDEELVMEEKDNLMWLVCRKFSVDEESDNAFRKSLKTYIEASSKVDGCTNISVRSFSGTSQFALYEIWDSEDTWKGHFGDKISKTFRHENVDHLEKPENMSTMPVPASWFKTE